MKTLSPKHREKIKRSLESSNGGFNSDNAVVAFGEREKHLGGGHPKKEKEN